MLSPMRAAWLLSLLCVLGCGSEDEPAEESQGWATVFEELPGALISVGGTSEHDVWAVGGNPGDGTGAFVLHFDGSTWRRISVGVPVDLWWVQPFDDGSVFMGGDAGTILRYQEGRIEKLSTPGTGTVFGIWGSSASDVWAVGGQASASTGAFIWRYDGTRWTAVTNLPGPTISAYFKVWGRSPNDVRIVGSDGIILHYDGTSLTQATSPTNRRLLTVHTAQSAPYVAVGGFGSPLILEDDGSGWKEVTPEGFKKPLLGVRMTGVEGYAVGNNGFVMHRDAGSWKEEDTGLLVFGDLHSVWIDPTGGVWAAGGAIAAEPLVDGVLLHKGKQVVGGSYEDI